MINPQAYTALAMVTVTTGSMFLVWIGEQITNRGIGNGISLLIFAGIVARLPNAIYALVKKMMSGEINAVVTIFVILLFVFVVVLVVYEQQGQRKIPVNYAKRVVGRKMYGAQNTYIPFKINPSGVIPVIFASSLLTFPLQIAQSLGGGAKWLRDFAFFLRPEGMWYSIFYVLFIVFFAYFYTQVSLNPMEISKNIRENGGSIPGIRSEKMEEYLTKILNRIVVPRLDRTDTDDCAAHFQLPERTRLPAWRHFVAYPCGCRPGYDVPGRGSAQDASSRRPYQTRPHQVAESVAW
jgi:preprotein translocase subunit SecY